MTNRLIAHPVTKTVVLISLAAAGVGVLRRGWQGAVGSLAAKQDFDATFESMLSKLKEIFDDE